MSINVKEALQNAAIVGAGGAGFPSYMKLAEGADTLLINGAECEPLIETDYILLREHQNEVVSGAKAVMEFAKIPRCLLCIKAHNAKRLSFSEGQVLAEGVFVKVLPDVYPMGDEISMIYEATGRVVRPGALPITAGCIVFNVETMYNAHRALTAGTPVTEKWLTVGGEVPEPFVVKVPVGTRVRDLFDHYGVVVPQGYVVIDGGPSMGFVVNPATALVKKNTKSLLILPEDCQAVISKKIDPKAQAMRASTACCQCTRCSDLCPRGLLGYPLLPHKMVRSVTTVAEVSPEMVLAATLCCNCGICEIAACCQNISPRAVIQEFKGILAKNKMKYVATADVEPDPAREYRKLPSERWSRLLGVAKYETGKVSLRLDGYQPRVVELGLNWHIGAPSVLSVSVGDTVEAGQRIAEAAAGLSVPQYASVSGKVTFADNTKVIIERD